MYLASCLRISSRRHAHSLLFLMRVPSSFVNGSGNLPLAISAAYSGSVPVTGHFEVGSSSLPQLMVPGLPPVTPLPPVPPALVPAVGLVPPALAPALGLARPAFVPALGLA